MKLFDFIKKLIETVVWLFFPDNKYRKEEELEQIPAGQDVAKSADVQRPTAQPLEMEAREAEVVEKPEPLPVDPEVNEVVEGEKLEPLTGEAPVADVEETATLLDEPEMTEIVKVEEPELQPTESEISEVINVEKLEPPPVEPQVIDVKELSSQLAEQEVGLIVEGGEPELLDTELVAAEVAETSAEVPKLLSVELEMVKSANAKEPKSVLDEPSIIEVDKDEKSDAEDYLEDEEVIEEDDIGRYEDEVGGEVVGEGPGVSKATSPAPRAVRREKEKTEKKSARCPFDRQLVLIDLIGEEEPDVDVFIKNLEIENLDDIFNLRIKRLDECFNKALQRYEYIGELPVTEKTYERLIEYLRLNARVNGKINPRHTLPTLFSVSMVFCARYSDTEAGEFWKPYAQQVWGCEPSQYFQNVCRKLFTYSREYLQHNLKLSFNIQNQGDVVRPVYQHAIIPSYLQGYFAEWLVNNFETLLQYPAEQLPVILQSEKSLDYVPKRLRDFIRGEETKETATHLITRMSNAVKLFHETEQTEAVESVMSSSIERSLWEVIYKKLINDQSQMVKLRRITPRLEWRWDLENDDVFLNLSNIRSGKSDKPDSVAWVEKDAWSLKGNDVLMKVYPWKTRSGDWEVDPVSIPAEGPLDGSILILSEDFDLDKDRQNQNNHIIFERTVPSLQKPVLFFCVVPRRNIAVQKEQIDFDGSWIITSSEHIWMADNAGNQVQANPMSIPYRLRESGFIQAGMYSIQLPITIHLGEETFVFVDVEDRQEINPSLRGTEKVSGLSQEIPPVFLSPSVDFLFSINPNSHPLRRTWLSLRRDGEFLGAILLEDLMNQGKMLMDGNRCVVDLSAFLSQSGAYSVNLLYNLRALLDEPVQFAWLPEGVEIIGPSPGICYSPLNPLAVTIKGVSEELVIPIHDEKSKITTDGDAVKIEWKMIRNSKCRFNILWESSPIHFCWNVDRVSAWIEGGGDKNRVTEGQEQDVVLQVRGKPKEDFSWIIEGAGKLRNTQLNARGELQANLLATEVRDMLLEDNRAKSTVSIAIRGRTWKLFDYYKKPGIEVTQVRYQRPELEISLTRVRKLCGTYTIQVRQTTDQSKPEVLSAVEVLEDNLTFQVILNPGEYRVEVLLYDMLVESSPTFQAEEESAPIEEISTKVQVIDDYGSREHLFRVLTATKQELLSRSFDRLLITPAIEQLQLIHTPEEWLTGERWNDGFKRLLPSWAVLMYPLRFTTKTHQRIFHVFPEKVAYGGRAGRGYIELKFADEKMRIAASWRPEEDQGYSKLWLGISQEQNIKFFSELDQDNLWPAYQCKDCGSIVASRDGTYLKLPPSMVRLHQHGVDRKLNEQFIDTVYDKQNIVEVSVAQYKEKPLQHACWAKEVVFNNYLQFLIEGKIRSIHGNLEQPINLYSNIDYGLAVSNLFGNLQLPAIQKLLEYSSELDQMNQYTKNEKDNVPAFSAMQRLMQYVYEPASPSNIPGNVLSLAMTLRLKANNPLFYSNLLANLGISEGSLVELVEYAVRGCPKMLEWSIAWAELFYVHSIS